MGCNKSKNRDVAENSHKKSKNKDQDVQQKQRHRVVNGQDEMKTAMKVKMGGAERGKRVRFEEPIPSNERIIAMEEEAEESEVESFHSAEGEVDTKKEKEPIQCHHPNN
ncbi:hypothetical protein Ddye_011856 [Dipteronia dyeriana]|uniref:Uncharacterized protein n=1 Tax=Dipteronia dyeriana TaxID=168575 RepID=A0AAE0CHR9_9ROSI|nr:hypothetical protein Ddye_011856 [Dipteronia dyeriana]